MNCTSCGHALWNLRTRQCPECGRGFWPSDYRFVPGTVAFKCPNCERAHFGHDAAGLPSPRAFVCEGCGEPVELDSMILAPVEGFTHEQTRLGRMPWLERRSRGRVRALFASIGFALVRPGRMCRNLPLNTPTGDVLAFGIAICLFSLLAGLLPILWLYLWIEHRWHFVESEFWLVYGSVIVGTMLIAAGLVPVLALFAHVMLRVSGGCAHGSDRTFQAFGASAGASIACAIPCFGWALGWMWWTISTIAALAAAQRVHVLRAAFAVVFIPLLLLGTLAGSSAMIVRQQMKEQARWNHPVVQMALAIHHLGWQAQAPPGHAVELMLYSQWQVDPTGSGRPFCHPGTRSTHDTVRIGDRTMAEILAMPRGERLQAVQEAIDSLPQNVVAHRLGDYIFTYHGAPMTAPNLWSVVMLPDPDVNGPPSPDAEIVIGTGDFGYRAFAFSDLEEELKEQNRVRATLGLPPLPDLTTITHDSPATSK